MKKVVTALFIIASLVIILDRFNAWHVIAMFYLAGEIPGTHTSVNAGTMMAIFALLIGFVLARIGNRFVLSLFDYVLTKRTNQHA